MDDANRHPLKTGHEAVRSTLKRAMREPGKTGEAARKVASLADGHFLREEKFVLPLLAMLPGLARGEHGAAIAGGQRLAAQLRLQLEQLQLDHRQISAALHELAAAAEAEGKSEYVGFAEDFLMHARTEEDVLYPAAIVAGECVRLMRAAAR
jgi:hypothetical protein